MSFASASDRLALRASVEASGFTFDFTLQVRKNGRESEIACDDLEHALTLSGEWIKTHNADYVEIFRVMKDGSINPTIGGFYKEGN